MNNVSVKDRADCLPIGVESTTFTTDPGNKRDKIEVLPITSSVDAICISEEQSHDTILKVKPRVTFVESNGTLSSNFSCIPKTINLNTPVIQTYSADTPLSQSQRALYWQRKSLLVYLSCLFLCTLINVPFAVAIAVVLRNNDLYHNTECHPDKALLAALSCTSFFFNFMILVLYGIL
eukprot:Awhi_evm1s15478